MATRRVLRNTKSRAEFVGTQNHITTLHARGSVEDLATGESNENTVREIFHPFFGSEDI